MWPTFYIPFISRSVTPRETNVGCIDDSPLVLDVPGAVGDFVVAYVFIQITNPENEFNIEMPTGWCGLAVHPNTSGTAYQNDGTGPGAGRTHVFFKFKESANEQITVNREVASGDYRICAYLHAYGQVNTSVPVFGWNHGNAVTTSPYSNAYAAAYGVSSSPQNYSVVALGTVELTQIDDFVSANVVGKYDDYLSYIMKNTADLDRTILHWCSGVGTGASEYNLFANISRYNFAAGLTSSGGTVADITTDPPCTRFSASGSAQEHYVYAEATLTAGVPYCFSYVLEPLPSRSSAYHVWVDVLDPDSNVVCSKIHQRVNLDNWLHAFLPAAPNDRFSGDDPFTSSFVYLSGGTVTTTQVCWYVFVPTMSGTHRFRVGQTDSATSRVQTATAGTSDRLEFLIWNLSSVIASSGTGAPYCVANPWAPTASAPLEGAGLAPIVLMSATDENKEFWTHTFEIVANGNSAPANRLMPPPLAFGTGPVSDANDLMVLTDRWCLVNEIDGVFARLAINSDYTDGVGPDKLYFEVTIDSLLEGSASAIDHYVGVQTLSSVRVPATAGSSASTLYAGRISYMANGTFNHHGNLTSGLSTWAVGNVIGVALDFSTNTVEFFKNGTLIRSVSLTDPDPELPVSMTGDKMVWQIVVANGDSADRVAMTVNTAGPFTYLPSGFSAWEW